MASITSIETIKSEAVEAAIAGTSKRDGCRFPFTSEQGRQWVEFYDEAEKGFEASLARYREAIEGVAA